MHFLVHCAASANKPVNCQQINNNKKIIDIFLFTMYSSDSWRLDKLCIWRT